MFIVHYEISRKYGTPHQLAPATPAHQRLAPEGQRAKEEPATGGAGGEVDEEQRIPEDRNHGRTSGVRGRNHGFLAASVSDLTQLPNNGAGRGEFNSPRGGKEARGRPSAAKGDNSSTKTRSRSPRGRDVCVWEVSQLGEHSLKTNKSATGWTQAPLKETARDRTRAPLRDAAKIRTRFRLEEISSVLSEEEKKWMVSYLPDCTQSVDLGKEKR